MELQIVHKPGRCGGDPTVGETRICVHNIVQDVEQYGSIEAVMADYPHRTRPIIEAALAYYAEHPAEIEAIWAANEAAYERGLREQRTRGAGSRALV